MQSLQSFMPGKRSNMRKMIRYTAEYDLYYYATNGVNGYNPAQCVCIPDNYVK